MNIDYDLRPVFNLHPLTRCRTDIYVVIAISCELHVTEARLMFVVFVRNVTYMVNLN